MVIVIFYTKKIKKLTKYFLTLPCKCIVMCMNNSMVAIWKKLYLFLGCIFMIGMTSRAMESLPQTTAVNWRDTLYIRLTDSVFVEAEKALVFSVEIYRPNDDWNKDKILGDFDLYFSYSNKAFSTTAIPSFESLLPEIDQSTSSRTNLLFGYTRFYAGRYGICGRADNSGGVKYTIPLRTWVKLCRVKIPMSHADQNPGIRWDVKTTGVMTAGGNPMILKLMGNVENNPKATVKAAGLHVMPELQCQGEDVYVYVRDAITSGKGLDFVWKDSVAGETWNTLGTFNASSSVKTGSSKNGRYQFQILGAGDTLVIKNSPGIVDGMFFRCTLSDASVGASMTVDTVVNLRDSLYAYLASTTPSVPYGMSGQIDTVKKCPELPANVNVYIFGPTQTEMKSSEEFGGIITLYYCYLDEDLNTRRDSVKINRTTLISGANYIRPGAANNLLNRDLFKASWTTQHTGKIWVESLKTDYCNNGAGYPLYDTLVIQEVTGDLNYNLDVVTVGVGECVDLDTVSAVKKPYEIFLKHEPSLIGGWVEGDNMPGYKYSYCADNTAGLDTVYYQYTKGGCTMKAYRGIEVVENSYLTMKVLLEGSYLGLDSKSQDTMRCVYMDQEKLGYEAFLRNNVGKLYSPYDENFVLATRDITTIGASGTICDWLLIKLKEAIEVGGVFVPSDNVLDSLSVFVLQDGSICGVDGKVVKFKNINSKKVYIQLFHRNHLFVRSNNAVVLPTTNPVNTFVVDFTKPAEVYSGNEMLKLVSGKYCLIAGDLNDDGYITVADKNIVVKALGAVQYLYDINFDNYVTAPDKNILQINLGAYSR